MDPSVDISLGIASITKGSKYPYVKLSLVKLSPLIEISKFKTSGLVYIGAKH